MYDRKGTNEWWIVLTLPALLSTPRSLTNGIRVTALLTNQNIEFVALSSFLAGEAL
jgi:hypothetical protein